MEDPQSERPLSNEEPEGFGDKSEAWGDYPLDDLLIRHENRTIYDVIRRIKQGNYVMDPDFQRDFIWPEDNQSKLIESVIMRIPLPVFYLAEDAEGRMVVVDGLQRLSTFQRFVNNKLKLRLPGREKLNGKKFLDLTPKLKNRIEDCNLIFYIIDSKVPERARLDIFDRVNSGMPLTRQQMRNSLFMGSGTRFLRNEAQTKLFLETTGRSLNQDTMRDREFVNRFCAFQLLNRDGYRGDMDEFLANCLRQMNSMDQTGLSQLSAEFHRGLTNNGMLFEQHAFRKHIPAQNRRNPLNVSLWDVMCTGLSCYAVKRVMALSEPLRQAMSRLFQDEDFNSSITSSTNDPRKVKTRFQMSRKIFKEVLGAHTD